jgi:hypothetical protein
LGKDIPGQLAMVFIIPLSFRHSFVFLTTVVSILAVSHQAEPAAITTNS